MSHNLNVKKFDSNLIKCIILCSITAILSLGWAIIEGNGFFTIRADLDVQQIPFTVLTHNMISDGFDGWCWNLDLGSSMIQGLSFYTLGSPFFWLSMLFPAKAFPYIIGIFYILKYIMAGVFAYIYIKTMVKDPKYAVLGALLYAFSGFQSTNLLFYHFHDVVAFFPLLLYGIEKAMSENKKSVFIFAIFINCFINYFFFVQEVVFLVIYFCFRFINGSLIDIIKKLLNCAFCGIFGIAMASVLFIPNIIYITSTTRNSVELALSEFFFNPLYSLFVAKGFLLPGETMHDNSSVISIDYSSTASYLPLVGLTLVIAYIIKNKNWLSRILKFLILLSFFPFASSCFILFTENNRRWWFMLTMLMALASAKVLENRHEYKKQITKGVIINAVALTAFYLAIRCLPWQNGSPETLTFHNIRLFGLYAITLSGIVLVFVITKFKKHHYKCMVAGIVAFCVLTTSTTLYFYRRNSYPDNTGVQTLFELGTKLNIIDDQYRYNITDGDAAKNILTMSGEVAGISCFSSTVANSLSEFDSLFNFQNFVIRMDKNTVNGLPELLGAKYYISPKIEDGANIVDQITANNEKFYIIEKEACPIGYSVSSYICKEDLMTIEKDKRGIALLSSAVIESDKEKYINKLLKKNTANDIDFEKPISEYVEDNTSMAVIDFNRSTKGFTCKSNYDNDSVIYFTVPYDEGWTALIDGKEAEIIPSGGMMLLPINAGEHNIEFVYNTPGLKLGFTISAIAISFYILLIAFEFIYKTKKNKIITRLGKDENVS